MLNLLFEGPAAWFTAVALIGTTALGVRLAVLLRRGADVDIAHAGDDDEPAAGLFSVEVLAALLAGMGWGGLVSLRGIGWNVSASALVGAFCGAALVWLLGVVLRPVREIATPDPSHTVGARGVAATDIPAMEAGRGRVRIVVDTKERTFDAVSVGPPLTAGSEVIVVGRSTGDALTVAPAAARAET